MRYALILRQGAPSCCGSGRSRLCRAAVVEVDEVSVVGTDLAERRDSTEAIRIRIVGQRPKQ